MSLFFRIRGPNIKRGGGQDIFHIPHGFSEIGRVPTPQDQGDARPECALPAEFVSRHHAKIEYTNTECWITDLDSMHGTAIDGRPLDPHQRTRVTPGDVITISGQFELTLEELPEVVEEEVDPGPVGEPHQFPIHEQQPRPYSGEIPPGLSLASLRLLNYLPEVYRGNQMALPSGTFNGNGSSGRKNGQYTLSAHSGGGGGNSTYLQMGARSYPNGRQVNENPMDLSFLSRYLALIESVWLPLEWTMTNFDLFFDARTVPDEFIPWLLTWFDELYNPSWTEKQLRTMLSITHRLHAKRGTRWALRWALWLYTGKEPDIDDRDEDLPADTFYIRLNVDANTVAEQSVRAIVDAYKPAHTFYEIRDL